MARKTKSYSLYFPIPFLGRIRRFWDKSSHIAGEYGGLLSFSVVVLWLVLWFALSDLPSRMVTATQNKVIEVSGGLGFSVQNILVEGRHYTDADILKALINIERGDPLFSFSPKEARSMIEKISWVKSVHIERRLPDTIYVDLEERRPLALWQHGKKLSLIDDEGIVLADHDLSRFKHMIVLAGEDVPFHAREFMDMLVSEPLVRDHVESAVRVGKRRWDLYLSSGAVAKLPETDEVIALRRLSIAQEQESLLEKDIQTIDVREGDRVVVRTAPGAVREYKAGYTTNRGI